MSLILILLQAAPIQQTGATHYSAILLLLIIGFIIYYFVRVRSKSKSMTPLVTESAINSDLKWHQKPIAIILFLIFFFPVGLYLMWKNEMWTKQSRWVITSIFLILIFANVSRKNSSNSTTTQSECGYISGRYYGTSQMGYTNGTAALTINDNCTGVLTYEQGSMGGATESGEIVKNGQNYKFISNKGGTYDLSISGNQVVLTGYNWQCVMTK